MRRRLGGALRSVGAGILAMLLVLAASPATAGETSAVRTATPLTDIGEQAITGLRGCLASTPKLDVYYLVDASGSLFADSEEHSDPDFERAPILANSLRQLGGIPGVSVNYATGFFGSRFAAGTPWTTMPTDTVGIDAAAAAFDQQVRTQPRLGATNWALGISQAQSELAAQKDGSGGCQLLIWFTDGAIDLNAKQATDDALNDLCGAPIRPGGHAPANGFGQFNELRQAEVVVVGAMLNTGAVSESQQAEMQALVESQSGGKVCQQNPIPEGYARGAFVRTATPADLAYVFLQLSAEVGGGFDASDDLADGTFQIDPGVARFVIATTDPAWSLVTPSGETLSKDSLGDVQQVDTSGAIQLSYAVDVKGETGEWTWLPSDPANAASLYLFSDLDITFDDSRLLRDETGAISGTLTGAVVKADGSPADVSLYDPAGFSIQVPAGSPDQAVTLDTDGSFAAEVAVDDSATGTSLTAMARWNPLTTALSGSSLAPIEASIDIPVDLPAQFPTVADVTLGTLVGTDGAATGDVVISGPAQEGASGEVCFPGEFTPAGLEDSADRADTWEFTHDGEQCVSVASGETVSVPMQARNEVAANSAVVASFPFTSADAEGNTIDLAVPVSFSTEKPFNAAVFGGLVILLIVLGLLLPLLLLWLLNFVTARIVHGRNLTRAEFPVVIGSAGIVGRGIDLGSPNLGTDEFRFQANSPGAREVSDRALGRLRARTPWWPLAQPWFEIVPPTGMLVFGPDARSPQKRAPAMVAGRRAAFGGDLGRLWAVAVPESGLTSDQKPDAANDGGTPGTLVVYTRTDAMNPNVFTDRMREVAMSFTATRARVTTAKDTLAAEQREQREKDARRPSTTGGAGAAAPAAAGASGVPPARSGDPSVPPPPPRRSTSGAPPPPARTTSAPPVTQRTADSPPARTPGTGASPPRLPPDSAGGDEPPPLPSRR